MHHMKIQELISPLDNRYNLKVEDLANNFSESNLNKIRFEIEIDWIMFLSSQCGKNFKPLSSSAKNNLLKNSPKYILVNSGNANACTGKIGMANAIKCTELLSKKFKYRNI